MIQTSLKKIIYISLPFACLCVILLLVLLWCNYRHKRKMKELYKQEQALLSNGDLKAEAVGDNTLRVSTASIINSVPNSGCTN